MIRKLLQYLLDMGSKTNISNQADDIVYKVMILKASSKADYPNEMKSYSFTDF